MRGCVLCAGDGVLPVLVEHQRRFILRPENSEGDNPFMKESLLVAKGMNSCLDNTLRRQFGIPDSGAVSKRLSLAHANP